MKTNNLQWKKKVSLPRKRQPSARKRKPSTRKRSTLQAKNEEFSTLVKKRPVINYFESTSILSVTLPPLGICQGLCPQRGICNQTSAPREKIFVVVVYVFGDLHWGSLRYCGVKEFFLWYFGNCLLLRVGWFLTCSGFVIFSDLPGGISLGFWYTTHPGPHAILVAYTYNIIYKKHAQVR